MLVRSGLLLLGVGMLLSATGCGTRCDFAARCKANILETCGPEAGPGPVGAKDTVSKEDCAAEGGVCVEASLNHAACQLPTCDATFARFCQGSLLAVCNGGVIQGVDCTADYGPGGGAGTCVDKGGGNAGCVQGP